MEIQRVPWAGWSVVSHIGSGGFGSVYEIRRKLFHYEEKAAVKVITIPRDQGDVVELRVEGYSDEGITEHFKTLLEGIVNEYTLMAQMKGHSNVVNCDDLIFTPMEDGIGWTIYIKMELLTPIADHREALRKESEVVRLAMDLCNALILCKKNNVVHRDIKPQNIFVSADGNYKLGDFGAAKISERVTSGTKIGTYKFMAPEIYNNQPYGPSVDIYSLGMVLYWLLNEYREPFLPLPPVNPTVKQTEEARTRRFKGENLPDPRHGDEALRKIVKKACAYRPEDRYGSPEEMLADLKQWCKVQAPSQIPVEIPAKGEPEQEHTTGITGMLEQIEAEIPYYEETERTARTATTKQEPPEWEETILPPVTEEDSTMGVWHRSSVSVKAPEPEQPSAEEEQDATMGVWHRSSASVKTPEPKESSPAEPKKEAATGGKGQAHFMELEGASADVWDRLQSTPKKSPIPKAPAPAKEKPSPDPKEPLVGITADEEKPESYFGGYYGKAPKEKKKKRWIIGIVAVLIAVAIPVSAIWIPEKIKYDRAMNLVSEGWYGDAAAKFEELGAYSDAEYWTCYCRYYQAIVLFQEGSYLQAWTLFSEAGDSFDARDQAAQSYYLYGQELLAGEAYGKAASVFLSLGDYEDAKDLARMCAGMHEASILFDNGSYEEAKEIYLSLGEVMKAKECDYQQGCKLLQEGAYEEAKKIFLDLGSYSDAKDKVKKCDYEIARELQEKGIYGEARDLFLSLDGYADSTDRANICGYEQATVLYESGDYEDAKAIFVSLGDYRDAKDCKRRCDGERAHDYLKNNDIENAAKLLSPIIMEDYDDEKPNTYHIYLKDGYEIKFWCGNWGEYIFRELLLFKGDYNEVSIEFDEQGNVTDIYKYDPEKDYLVWIEAEEYTYGQ